MCFFILRIHVWKHACQQVQSENLGASAAENVLPLSQEPLQKSYCSLLVHMPVSESITGGGGVECFF